MSMLRDKAGLYKPGDWMFTSYYNVVDKKFSEIEVEDIVIVDYPANMKVKVTQLRLHGISFEVLEVLNES